MVVTIDQEFKELIPAPSDEERAQLEANIQAEGCRDPLVTWEGVLLDGHNRYEICSRLAIPFDTVSVELADREAAIDWIERNQIGRRNLTADQRRYFIGRVYNRKKKAANDGGKGVPKSTVDQNDPRFTADKVAADFGVSAPTVKRAAKFAEEIDANQDIKRAVIDGRKQYKEAKKELSTKAREEARAELAAKAESVPDSERWSIIEGDIASVEINKQYDYIVTDPPYPREYLPLWSVLAERAKAWLRPGGLLIAMSGQMYLPQIYSMLGEHLEYYWTGCYLTPGQPTSLRHVNVNTTWKPILVYRNGEYSGKTFGDVYKSDANDKDFHKWGQSVSGMRSLVEKMCAKGSSILDPFCGAGTTGLAALANGCFFDGIEIDAQNVAISRARIGAV